MSLGAAGGVALVLGVGYAYRGRQRGSQKVNTGSPSRKAKAYAEDAPQSSSGGHSRPKPLRCCWGDSEGGGDEGGDELITNVTVRESNPMTLASGAGPSSSRQVVPGGVTVLDDVE